MKTDLRVTLTKRMLKDGLLRMLERETLSKVSISELCKESGVNRATFYNHYEFPAMILRDIAYEYEAQMSGIFEAARRAGGSRDAGMEACLQFILERKSEIKILFSKNAEYSLNRFGLDIVNEKLARQQAVIRTKMPGDSDDHFLYAVATASAAFGLIDVWLTMDIDKTPRELVGILKRTTGDNLLL